MIDLARCSSYDLRQWDVEAGQDISEEGLALTLSTATARAVKLAGSGSTIFVGLAFTSNISVDTKAEVESGTVSDDTLTLSHDDLVAGQITVYDSTSSATLVEGSASNAGEYSVDDSTGVITFNAAQDGDSVVVYYRRNLSSMEAKQLYHQSLASQTADQDFGTIMVMMGNEMEVYTDIYADDVAAPYALGNAIYTGANGTLTKTSGGKQCGRVIKLPTATDPTLGVMLSTNLV